MMSFKFHPAENSYYFMRGRYVDAVKGKLELLSSSEHHAEQTHAQGHLVF